MANKRLKVLVVDDSAVVRQTIRLALERHPQIDAVETAADGAAALRKLERFDADVVTLDVQMAGLDGLATLERIMATSPRHVIMLSSFTFDGAYRTIRALELGAGDFLQKPGAGSGVQEVVDELVAKVTALASRARPKARRRSADAVARAPEPARPRRATPPVGLPAPAGRATVVVAIGASTGGTEAIRFILSRLNANFPAAILIAQHMPTGFTAAFAKRLNELCAIEVKEAAHHDLVLPGRALVAPGNSHLVLRREGTHLFVDTTQDAEVSGHRPSVDVLFRSTASVIGHSTVGVQLTGMGRDGASGLLTLRRAGATTIAQNEESSIVFGMPKAAIEDGAAQVVAALEDMPRLIVSAVSKLSSHLELSAR
jgi:two-component system chemotaxis response regulator CheB